MPSHHHDEILDDDDDDYTQIFGVGSDLGGVSLWIGFCSVAAYLIIFSGLLNKLEKLTFGTSYHLMLQRIYREIMMVGLGSFAFTILNQTNTQLPFGLSQAFGFADICCFAMASFFCLQGVFIMVASIKQAHNWNVASQIPAEELLHNMSVWELSHPLAWRARYLPFCPTREQVEFRVLRSIFATAYNIKASHSEFDFSIFFRMTHEKNILKIIDISFKNWFYILFLTGLASLKLSLWESKCSTENCETKEEIEIFAACGAVYGVLSMVLWIWGRLLEIRLIASVGVESVEDYPIFLMTEFRTEETLADCATSTVLAKDVISSFMKEKETNEVKSKEAQYVSRRTYMKRVANGSDSSIGGIIKGIVTNSFSSKHGSGIGGACVGTIEEDEEEKSYARKWNNDDDRVREWTDDSVREWTDDVTTTKENEKRDDSNLNVTTDVLTNIEDDDVIAYGCGVGESDNDSLTSEQVPELRVKPASTPSVQSVSISHRSSGVHIHPNAASSRRKRSSGIPIGSPEDSIRSKRSSDLPTTSDVNNEKRRRPLIKRLSTNKMLNRGMSMIVSRKKKNGIRRLSFFSRASKGAAEQKRKLSRQASMGLKQLFSKRSMSNVATLSAKERQDRFANIVKSNFGKQNFKNLFLFRSPELFYNLIIVVITCNSLYLAWWATNFIFLMIKMDHNIHLLFLVSISLLPPLVTFPTIFLAIRSSTIMKAITLLDVEVVAKVIEQSEINTNMLAEFRKTLLRFMKKQGAGIEGMMKTCSQFAESNANCMKKSEFREMLLHHKVIYTPEKINFLFGSIDLNGGNTADFGELENFLFSDANYESDKKRQEIFRNMSIHTVKSGEKKGKKAAVRILKGLNIENFKEKNFITRGASNVSSATSSSRE